MSGWAWYLIAMYALGVLVTVGRVGKRREPVSPMEAVITLLLAAVGIYAVLNVAGVA